MKPSRRLDLQDKTVVLTGTFTGITRDEATAQLTARGAKVTDSVSKNTHFLFAGEKAGSKRAKAESLGIPVLSEADLLAYLADAPGKSSSRSPKSASAPAAAAASPSAAASAPASASADAFAAFKARASKHGLDPVIEKLEEAIGDDWKLIHFAAPPSKGKTANESTVEAIERKHAGAFPPKLRKTLLDTYAAADGFSFAIAPARMPAANDPAGAKAWAQVDGPIGHTLLPLDQVLAAKAACLFRSDDPFSEGGIEELFASSLKKGAKPQSAFFSFFDQLRHDKKRTGFERIHYERTGSAIALKTKSFPGGYLSQDGDLQWTLVGDEEEQRPSVPPFAEHLAEALERIIDNIKSSFHAVSFPAEPKAAPRAEAPKKPAGPVERARSIPPDWRMPFVVRDGAEAEPLRAFFARFPAPEPDSFRDKIEIVPDDVREADIRDELESSVRVIRQRELRQHLPSPDEESRLQRLRMALAEPKSPISSEALAEATMLLMTWDKASLPRAVTEATKALTSWPVPLRWFTHEQFHKRPELASLVIAPPYGPERVSFAARAPQTRVLTIHDETASQADEHHRAFGHITHLHVDLRTTPVLDALRRWTGLSGVVQLNIHGYDEDCSQAAIPLKEILALPHLRGVEELNILSCKLSKETLQALVTAPQKLRAIRISDSLSSAGGEGALLAAIVGAHRLVELTIENCELKDTRGLFAKPDDWRTMQRFGWLCSDAPLKDAGALVKARFDEIRELRLVELDGFTKEHAVALAGSSTFSKLEHLEIRYCKKLGTEGAAAILTSKHLPRLRYVELSSCDIAFPALVKAAAGKLEGPPVETLILETLKASPASVDWDKASFLRNVHTLSFEHLDGDAQTTFWSCPHLAQLEHVDLGSAYGKEDAVVQAMAAAAPPPRLRTLKAAIRLTDEQATLFARSALAKKLGGITIQTRENKGRRALLEAGLAFVPSQFENKNMQWANWVTF